MDIQLKRGYVEICVLASMLREESYGYKMIKDISPYIEISESTLYPILKRLESAHCVTVHTEEHNGRLRKYYLTTVEGRKRIGDFLRDWEDVMRAYDYIKGEYGHEEN